MSQSIRELVDSFDRCEVRREEWTHRAHLAYALVKLLEDPVGGPTAIKNGILRFNEAAKIEQTLNGGYHESITVFYIAMVRRFIAEADCSLPLHDLVDQLVERYGDRSLPYQFYTRERLHSWAAKTTWLEPDLRPL